MIMWGISDFTSTVNYLNQITHLESGGGSFHIHHWNAKPSHLDNQLHKHSFFEICYVVSGTGLYVDGNLEFKLKSGDLFCSRPHVWHRIHQGHSLYLLWISFEIMEGQSTDHALANYKRMQFIERFLIREAQKLPAILVWQSILMQAGQQNGLKDILQPLASGFLATLINSFLADPEHEHSITLNNDPERILQQAKAFIHDNLSRPLQLKDVANYLHVSERNLSRLFLEYNTLTFVQLLKAERLKQASDLLKYSNKSIKDIAMDTGFESVHYFTRVFTSSFGIPPGKYRKQ